MKLIYYSVVFLLLFSCLRPRSTVQKPHFDNFKDYSYLLFQGKIRGEKNSISGVATGFFVKYHDTLYLVSAEHVLTGNDPFRVIRIDSLSPDFLTFYYNTSNNTVKGFENLYLDSIKKANPPRYIKNHPDLITLPVNLPPEAEIISIENTINPNAELNVGDSVFFWGFPEIRAVSDSDIIYRQDLDPIKYSGVAVGLNDSLYYASIPNTKQTVSGSPVFVKKIIRGRDRFYFIGILCAGSELSGMAFFVRYNQLLRSINYVDKQ